MTNPGGPKITVDVAQAGLEAQIYQRLDESLGLNSQIALYDLTNTYFEGLATTVPMRDRQPGQPGLVEGPGLPLSGDE